MQHPGRSVFPRVQTGGARARLSALDLYAWSEALREIPTGAVGEAEFRAWVEGPLRRFFPFERFYSAYGSLDANRVQMHAMLTIGHSPAFVASRFSVCDLNVRKCFAWFVSTRRAVLMDETGAIDAAGTRFSPSERELDDLARYALGSLAAHGVIDPFAKTGTYHGFAGVPTEHPELLLALLELISPVLHTLYLQTKPFRVPAVDGATLTDRQRELVELAALGLSDKEIGSRLGISDHTVGNHFRAIYSRLGVSKRSQLVAVVKSREVG